MRKIRAILPIMLAVFMFAPYTVPAYEDGVEANEGIEVYDDGLDDSLAETEYTDITLDEMMSGTSEAPESASDSRTWFRLTLDRSYMLKLYHSHSMYIYKNRNDEEYIWMTGNSLSKTGYGCLMKGTYYVKLYQSFVFGEDRDYEFKFSPVNKDEYFQTFVEDHNDPSTRNDTKDTCKKYSVVDGVTDCEIIHGLLGNNNNVDWYHLEIKKPVKLTFGYVNYDSLGEDRYFMPTFKLYRGNSLFLNTEGMDLPVRTKGIVGDYYLCVTKYNYENNNTNFHSYDVSTTPADKTVTYDANGGEGLAPIDSGYYSTGDKIKLQGATGLTAERRFIGWCTDPDGDGTLYSPGDEFTIGDSSVTFYAQWEGGPIIIPEYDYDDEIAINYAGHAIAHVRLVDDEKEPIVEPGTTLRYSNSMGTSEIEVEQYGFIDVISDNYLYSSSGENSHKFRALLKDTAGNRIAAVNINNIVVENISFSQKWTGKMDASGTVKAGWGFSAGAGPADIAAKLGEVSATASMATTMELENSYENGVRNLKLGQAYDRRLAAKASIGPAAEALNGAVEIKGVELYAKGGVGQQVSSGIVIKDYDPNNTEHLKKIGKYILLGAAESHGNALLMNLLELIGYKNTSDTVSSILTFQGSAGLDVLKGSLSGFGDGPEASLLSAEAEGVVSYETTRDRSGSSGPVLTKKEKRENNREVKLLGSSPGDFGLDVTLGEVWLRGLSDENVDEISVSGKLNSMYDLNASEDRIDKISYETSFYKGDSICFDEYNHSIARKVEYSGEDAKQIASTVPKIGRFYTNTLEGLSIDDLKGIENTTVPHGKFSDSHKLGRLIDIPLKLGLQAGLGADVGVELIGEYEESVDIHKGTYNYNHLIMEREPIIQSEIDGNVFLQKMEEEEKELLDILAEPMKVIANLAAEYLVDKIGKAGETIANGLAKITDIVGEKAVHLTKLISGDTGNGGSGTDLSLLSYEISVYPDELEGNPQTSEPSSNVASTIGEPYVVYLTDDDGNEVTDWDGDSVTLTIGYTDEMLTAAGASKDDAPLLAIYMYSQEKLGYIRKGGTVDTENMTVTLTVTEGGQYIIALDKAAPKVTVFATEDDSNPPVIVASFDEMSGFGEFSLTLDGVEVLGLADLDDHYDANTRSIRYQVESELSPGLHKATLMAADEIGNRMAEPAELEININDVLTDVSINKNEAELYTGETLRLMVSFEPSENVNTRVTWLSSKESVATVDTKGVVKAVSEGEADITVTAEDGGLTATCHVTVKSREETENTLSATFAEGAVRNDPFEGLCLNADNGHYETVYTGAAIEPQVTVKFAGKVLKEGEDYTIKYGGNVNYDTKGKPATVTVTGKGNYAGKKVLNFYIIQTDLALAKGKGLLTAPEEILVVSGKKASPVIVYCGRALKATEMNISNKAAIKADTAIDVEGKGSFTGKLTGIRVKAVTAAYAKDHTIAVSIKAKTHTYNGQKQMLTYASPSSDGELTVTAGSSKTKLTRDRDFSVSYDNDVYPGTATVTVTGKGDYYGTVTKTFKIQADTLSDITAVLAHPDIEIECDPAGTVPEISVKASGKTLTEGTDYKLTYTNNKKPGTGKYNVAFLGNYKGHKAVSGTFTIVPATFRYADVLAPDMVYTKEGKYLSAPYVTIDGVLVSSKDYSVKYYQKGKEIPATGKIKLPEGTDVTVITVKVTGKGNYKPQTVSSTYKVIRPADGAVKLSEAKIVAKEKVKNADAAIAKQEYTGREVKPEIRAVRKVGRSTEDVPADAYETVYINNVSKGKATVLIIGNGRDAIGCQKADFTITTRNM